MLPEALRAITELKMIQRTVQCTTGGSTQNLPTVVVSNTVPPESLIHDTISFGAETYISLCVLLSCWGNFLTTFPLCLARFNARFTLLS
jgi:hypothetical protein